MTVSTTTDTEPKVKTFGDWTYTEIQDIAEILPGDIIYHGFDESFIYHNGFDETEYERKVLSSPSVDRRHLIVKAPGDRVIVAGVDVSGKPEFLYYTRTRSPVARDLFGAVVEEGQSVMVDGAEMVHRDGGLVPGLFEVVFSPSMPGRNVIVFGPINSKKDDTHCPYKKDETYRQYSFRNTRDLIVVKGGE